MVRDAEEGYHGPDLAIKWLSDLDTVFFAGCLKGNVNVSVSILSRLSCPFHVPISIPEDMLNKVS